MEMRRSGYRGNPSQVADYLTSTEGAGDGHRGTFPAIDISDDFCGLFSYARQHSCVPVITIYLPVVAVMVLFQLIRCFIIDWA